METASGTSLTGQVIDGKLEIKELIGEGGMGSVYRVLHWEWNTELALKVPRPELLNSSSDRTRWIREANTWIDLGLHPNIVPCWFVREWKRVPVLFLDFLPGGSLKEGMLEVDKEDFRQLIDWAIQMCDGLYHAHRRGLVHRDVKPANILVGNEGQLCVTDFGLVKFLQDGHDTQELQEGLPDIDSMTPLSGSTLTATGALVGTPHYAAPEQWMGSLMTSAVDIYALGVIFYQFFTGRHPFLSIEEKDLAKLVTGHIQKKPDDIRDHNPKATEKLAAVVASCLAKAPSGRPKDCAVLRTQLVECYEEIVGKRYPRPEPKAASQRADALNNKAVSLWSLGETQDAFSAWLEASKLEALHPETTFNRAMRQWKSGRITDSEVLDRLERARKAHPGVAAYQGYFYLAALEPEKARDALLEAVENTNKAHDGLAWRALGDSHLSLERWEEAERAYREALARIPEDRVSQRRLSLAEKKTRARDGEIEVALGPPLHHYCFPGIEWGVVCEAESFFVIGDELMGVENETGVVRWKYHVVLSGKRLEAVDGYLFEPGGPEGIVLTRDQGAQAYQFSQSERCFAFVKDHTFVIGSVDLKLFDVATGKPGRRLTGHDKLVNAMVVSSDGSYGLSGACDRTVRHWNLKTGECLHVLREHKDYVQALVLAEAHNLAATGDRSGVVKIWLVSNGECIGSFEGHEGAVEQLFISEAARFLCVVHRKGEVTRTKVWDLRRRTALFDEEGEGRIWRSLLFFRGESGLSAWTLEPFLRLRRFHHGAVEMASWGVAPDGKVWVIDKNGEWSLWESAPASAIPEPPLLLVRATSHRESEQAREAFERFLEEGDVNFIEGDYGAALLALSKARSVSGYEQDARAFSLQARLLSKLGRREVRTFWERASLEEPSGRKLRSADISNDGRWLLSAAGAVIRLWDLRLGSCVRGLNGHRHEVIDVRFVDGGKRAVSIASDNSLRVWNPTTGECLEAISDFDDTPVRLAVSEDGKRAAVTTRTNKIYLYQLTTKKFRSAQLRAEPVHLDLGLGENEVVVVHRHLEILNFHKPSQVLFTQPSVRRGWSVDAANRLSLMSRTDGVLELWDRDEEKVLRSLTDIGGEPLAWSSRFRQMLIRNPAGHLMIGSFPAGEVVSSQVELPAQVGDIRMTPDARYIMVVEEGRRVRVWELDWRLDESETEQTLEELFPVITWWGRIVSKIIPGK